MRHSYCNNIRNHKKWKNVNWIEYVFAQKIEGKYINLHIFKMLWKKLNHYISFQKRMKNFWLFYLWKSWYYLSIEVEVIRWRREQEYGKSSVDNKNFYRIYIRRTKNQFKQRLYFYQSLSNHLGSIFRTGISDLQSNSFLDEVVIKV